jgi:uncharacterized membrane protein
MAKQDSSHPGGDRLLALLSYLSILFLIPMLLKDKNSWIHKHGKQGFIFFLGTLLVWIPLLGWIWGLYLIVVWVIVVIKVLAGTPYWKIPIVGDIAEKLDI